MNSDKTNHLNNTYLLSLMYILVLLLNIFIVYFYVTTLIVILGLFTEWILVPFINFFARTFSIPVQYQITSIPAYGRSEGLRSKDLFGNPETPLNTNIIDMPDRSDVKQNSSFIVRGTRSINKEENEENEENEEDKEDEEDEEDKEDEENEEESADPTGTAVPNVSADPNESTGTAVPNVSADPNESTGTADSTEPADPNESTGTADSAESNVSAESADSAESNVSAESDVPPDSTDPNESTGTTLEEVD